ncbi:MAG: hypothetical protein JWQ62_3064, partial [Lacunisphaera sp.]|nr:hypothetical protein [Lacunisphaera sp.]
MKIPLTSARSAAAMLAVSLLFAAAGRAQTLTST